MSSSASSPPAAAGQPPAMRLASDRHVEASDNLSTAAIASRLPRTLSQAARLGWRTDRRAVLALLVCQIGAAALTATALAATARALAAVFTGDDIAARLRGNLTAVVVHALATSSRYPIDGRRSSPCCTRGVLPAEYRR
ncbi:hypothetical protein [Streptomyces sp. MAR4 CNX-425]|uniref:hypothetical protein n=1 Tax=Streptomyces sp. MAR4 CNX-425 TaxID=3406343 RepID=UPI003B50EFCB